MTIDPLRLRDFVYPSPLTINWSPLIISSISRPTMEGKGQTQIYYYRYTLIITLQGISDWYSQAGPQAIVPHG